MTEREGAEGSQLSQALDFVPRRGAFRAPLHREKIINSLHPALARSYLKEVLVGWMKDLPGKQVWILTAGPG